ncbi:serine hydrolase [uncultured Pseudacidovorax sp.]|uniref:serine hydrolase domain-containing protein n=1 Tax=uncultured Pseudacidovorax sp. TaxID=679313 RepID=UPI0025F55B50|nr:serine hydrolase [uncultured Pseudacidovorax sp.]
MQNETSSRRALISRGLALTAGSLLPLPAAVAAESPADWAAPKVDASAQDVAIRRVLDEAQSVAALRSVLVVRNGDLVAEQYYGGATASALQGVNSVTKSVASMLVGMAIAQGWIKGLSETVGTLLPSAAAKAPGSPVLAITLEQILSGTSGLVYDFRTGMAALQAAEDPVAYVLSLPVDPAQVGRWGYNDAAVSLLSPILTQAQGMPVDQLAQRDLFGPLGIERVAAVRDKAGRFMSYGGLRLRARDLAKIAWTMADDGRWKGRQVVPQAWVDASTRPRVPTTWQAGPVKNTSYGYLWFSGSLTGRPVFWAWGYGAQFALVVPSLRLVVTTTATNPPVRELAAQNSAVMTVVERIVAAAG